MKIDEAAFERAFGPEPSYCSEDRDDWLDLRRNLATYLAALPALPSAEPGRDRIAVVVNAKGVGTADVMPADPSLFDWENLEVTAVEYGCEGPFAQNVVRCTLTRPRPAEPVEVEGSVEGVEP